MNFEVIKRDGSVQRGELEKITLFLKRQSEDLRKIEVPLLIKKIAPHLKTTQTTKELGILIAETSASLTILHPEYDLLGGRVEAASLHKETPNTFLGSAAKLRAQNLFSQKHQDLLLKYEDVIEKAIDYKRDFDFSFFAFRTLKKNYLNKLKTGKGEIFEEEIAERPQHLFMRVALAIHEDDIERVLETYDLMSKKFFIHGSPTLFSACNPNGQLSSCFVTNIQDSIEGIYDTLRDCAVISKNAGGIGLSIHDVRGTNSLIRSMGGLSDGIVPLLKVYDATSNYVNQGGKRLGAFAVYIEPWHCDIEKFLQLKRPTGPTETKARNLFYGLWVPDLFMERVKKGEKWSLMCPSESPGLSDCWGSDFERLYTTYEGERRFVRQVEASSLWSLILRSQKECGMPYLLFKDTCNAKSNHRNLGTIKGSNLCAEIIQFYNDEEMAVCNLASIALNLFVKDDKTYNYDLLEKVVAIVTRNLDRVIDVNKYVLDSAKKSNLRHRPIGIGVQGLADTFAKMQIPFESVEARKVNMKIFESIYFAALKTSSKLAYEKGGVYPSYEKSPISEGYLQQDFWPDTVKNGWKESEKWKDLRLEIRKNGVRNSLLIALMPTASTAQILGNTESVEPFLNNVFTRKVLSGEFQVVNKYLVEDLEKLNLWTTSVREKIILSHGSLKAIEEIPKNIKERYKTVWEINPRWLIDLAVERGIFVDQSQSMNLYFENPSEKEMTQLYFYAWKMGLKTGLYYLRSRTPYHPVAFCLQAEKNKTCCS